MNINEPIEKRNRRGSEISPSNGANLSQSEHIEMHCISYCVKRAQICALKRNRLSSHQRFITQF